MKWVTCRDCTGTLRQECEECFGLGEDPVDGRQCPECFGAGNVDCDACVGEGGWYGEEDHEDAD